ncbi:probable carotenoid cleavage dioxygenase 4, chloroplastic [Amborella trichopoda]|uniref:Uncharacterized protein n=1 Tax=Amborella trichopoda TaxID=13333 RepID=W1NGY7_AMBTC|nr:probable carotenoid cleavage dioxygenase 4, chloroplastic [Amborella trichopoda]ERM94748.1 hypothetical protein AMTR_s00011p00255760 [Amborella trichopoda]|eukprot:XP_006878603.1 probable carotenoid cleavage dioxygenase 4, chloroplastic [Amborella trichopoda]
MDAFSSSLFSTSLCHHSPPRPIPVPTCVRLPPISAVQIQEKPTSQYDAKPEAPASNGKPSILEKPATVTPQARRATLQPRVRPRRAERPVGQPSLVSTLCNTMDGFITSFIEPPPRPSIDPKHVLAGNFHPVSELPPTPCLEIEGTLPSCINGAYLRNGPNPAHLPRGAYHLFDGDGMVHCLRISNGQATYSARFVKTYKYDLERKACGAVYPNFFGAMSGISGVTRGAVLGARVLAGEIDLTRGGGVANTSFAFFGGTLYALGESDLPYAIRVTDQGDIETMGRENFEGRLALGMTAHPKTDPKTRETFAFRYAPIPPFLTYFRFDKNGSKFPDVPVFSVLSPPFMHDFTITEKYAIFHENQITMDPAGLVTGGAPAASNSSKVPRLGVMPRDSFSGDVRWFDIPGCNFFHLVNAWDEGPNAITIVTPNTFPAEHALEAMHLIHSSVEIVRLDLKTGAVTRRPVSTMNLEFGIINQRFLGRKNRFAYMSIGAPMPKIKGVVKLDLEREGKGECVVAQRVYEEGWFGSEPAFVAKRQSDSESEDDGYVVAFLHEEATGEARFVVMDVASSDLKIVASVRLPQRVPYGFHSCFLTEEQLISQRSISS